MIRRAKTVPRYKFMTKKNWLVIFFLLAMTTIYVVWFSDWFKPRAVQIFHTYRNLHPRLQRDGVLPSLIFGLGQPLKITEIKVVPLAEFQTNPNVVPLWHLISDSNSVPIKSFFYGQNIRGLRPEFKGVHSQSPETNVTYRLFVCAGKIKGTNDFELK
jgi:hypothetical protein